MMVQVLKVSMILIIINYLVSCSKNTKETSLRGKTFTEHIKTEKNWIGKTISEILKVKRGAVEVLHLRNQEIIQTHEIDKSENLGNVSKSFPLIVRLTKLWPLMNSLVMSTFAKNLRNPPNYQLDGRELWKNGVISLLRVQQAQNLTADSLATSMEGPYHITSRLDATCYDVGLFFYKEMYAALATEWFLAALKRAPGKAGRDLRLEIMEYLHLAQCFKGDTKGSIITLQTLLEEAPRFSPNLSLKDDYNLTANTSCIELARKIKPTPLY